MDDWVYRMFMFKVKLHQLGLSYLENKFKEQKRNIKKYPQDKQDFQEIDLYNQEDEDN